jgi:hypothetical protein
LNSQGQYDTNDDEAGGETSVEKGIFQEQENSRNLNQTMPLHGAQRPNKTEDEGTKYLAKGKKSKSRSLKRNETQPSPKNKRNRSIRKSKQWE